MAKKILRKNEFRYDTNPVVRNPKGEGHMAYVSARYGHRSKVNIITHAKTFFGEPTQELKQNPNLSKPSERKSYYSVPRWEKDKYLTEKPKDVWRISKQDRTSIRKFNARYEKKRK